jgi:general transcription factor IIIA
MLIHRLAKHTSAAAEADESDEAADNIVNFTGDGKLRAESEARRQWNHVCEYPGCGQRFNRPCRLEAHMRRHNKERPFACTVDDCDKTFPRKDHLQRHLKTTHAEQERNFACDWEGCRSTFTSLGRLQRHKDVHTSKFYCTGYGPCNEAFRKKATLDAHIKTAHLEAKPFPCPFVDPDTNERCTHGYQTTYKLEKHLQMAHHLRNPEADALLVQQHYCMDCVEPGTELGNVNGVPQKPLCFPTREALEAHAHEVHPPICPVCGHRATGKNAHTNLKDHYERMHGGKVEQWPCPREGCDSVFTRKNNLKTHIQAVHEKQLKFFCTSDAVCNSKHDDLNDWDGENACGAPFKAKSSLIQHIRTHHLGLQNRKATRQMAKSKKKPGLSSLSLLTGVGYDRGREIPCVVRDCEYRFYREVALRVHLQAEHFFTDEDVEMAILERNAMSGGQFWLGGLDEPLSMFDSTEPSGPQTPMPYFTTDSTQMQDGLAKHDEHPFGDIFDRSLGDLGMVDADAAALDAEMGLSHLQPAVDVHEGLPDHFLDGVQHFLQGS